MCIHTCTDICVFVLHIKTQLGVCVRSVLLINAISNVCTNCLCNSKSIKSLGLLFSSNREHTPTPPPPDAQHKKGEGNWDKGMPGKLTLDFLTLVTASLLICTWVQNRVLEEVLYGSHFSINKKNGLVLAISSPFLLWVTTGIYMRNTSYSARDLFEALARKTFW